MQFEPHGVVAVDLRAAHVFVVARERPVVRGVEPPPVGAQPRLECGELLQRTLRPLVQHAETIDDFTPRKV